MRKHALDHGVPCETVPHEWYFPEPGDRDLFEKIEATRRLCETCPVRVECLQWALDEHITSGMYGGVPASERQRMSYSRQRPGRAPRRRRAAA